MNHDQLAPRSGSTVYQARYWIVTVHGARLRRMRRKNGLSQKRLSHTSGVSLGTIQRIEKLTVAACQMTTVHRLAAALDPADPSAVVTGLTRAVSDARAIRTQRNSVPCPRDDPWWQRGLPFPADRTEHPKYDAARAHDLLTRTGEFPDSKGGLLMLLTEYRHALYDLATLPADPNATTWSVSAND